MAVAETFALPSVEKLSEIGRELSLSVTQSHELGIALRHAHDDLNGFFQARIDRPERARRVHQLNSVHEALETLIVALGGRDGTFDDVNESLPFDAREAIGASVNDELAEVVTGRRVCADHNRRSVGLLNGARLLVAQLRQIKAPIDSWLSAYQADPGGPEPDYVRNYVINVLAESSVEILGRRATASAGGSFVRLVAAVFLACGLDDTGLEKRIDRVLRLRRKPSP